MASNFKYPFPSSFRSCEKSLLDTIKVNWKLNRTAVNEDTDKFAAYLKKKMGSGTKIHELTAGKDCLTWRVPLHWRVRKAYIARESGEKIVDFNDNALHLWTHSIPIDQVVSREELDKHILTNPRRPDEIEYHFRNGYRYNVREWGFSIPHRIVKTMTDARYRVYIDADLDTKGSIKVVDAVLPGRSKDTIVFMAHTCHPWTVNDGLSCVATLVELYKLLQGQKDRKYTYRFIFGPEYFAAATFLHLTPRSEVRKFRYGCFLDMVGTHEPIGMQVSFQGNSLIDRMMKNVLKTHAGTHLIKSYRKLWPNDETFYNGPGFAIPTVGFGRGMYREYHHNTDDLENLDLYHCVESLWILSRVVEVFETDFIPKLRYDGPLYLSPYGLYIDPYLDPRGNDAMEFIQYLMDGKRSCFEIADQLKLDYFFVYNFARQLVEKRRAKSKPSIPKPESPGEPLSCSGLFEKPHAKALPFPWDPNDSD